MGAMSEEPEQPIRWREGHLSSKTSVRTPITSALSAQILRECGYARLSEVIGQAAEPKDVRERFNELRPGAKRRPDFQEDKDFEVFCALLEEHAKDLLDGREPPSWFLLRAENGRVAAAELKSRYGVTLHDENGQVSGNPTPGNLPSRGSQFGSIHTRGGSHPGTFGGGHEL